MKRNYYFRAARKLNLLLLRPMNLQNKMRIFMDVGADLGFGHFLSCQKEVEQGVYLLKSSIKHKIKTAVDAGANVGEYSEALLKNFPKLKLVQFEPNPIANKFLRNKFKNDKRVITEQLGLAAKTGTSNFLSSGDFDASAHVVQENQKGSFKIKTTSLDDYLAQSVIKKIDWLKIDVEGLDFEVLKGFQKNISRTLVIQFEISTTSLGQTRLLDFWRILHPTHEIYRISPGGPKLVSDYSFSDEIFWGTNYLAIKKFSSK